MTRTPGPWHVHAREPHVIMTDHCLVAECGDTTPEDCANAALIAAAPDLLADLRALAHLADVLNNRQHAGLRITPTMWAELYQLSSRCKATIGKAEGREP